MTKTHWVLSTADDLASAREAVLSFFSKSILLSYDAVLVIEQESYDAADDAFWRLCEEGVAANRLILDAFMTELRATGCQTLDDLASLPTGYPSKVLHLIAHLQDGFIGIDSVFYNLVEDSHWISHRLGAAIRQTPGRYWLLKVDAEFSSAESAAFLHLTKK